MCFSLKYNILSIENKITQKKILQKKFSLFVIVDIILILFTQKTMYIFKLLSKGVKNMEQLKRLIFEQMNKLQIENTKENQELYTLVFGIFKENAKTKQINPCVWLYLNNDYNSFSYILQDILQQAITEHFTDTTTAYKNTLKYVYNQYYKTQTRQRPLEYHENEITTTIDTEQVTEHFTSYEIKLDTEAKKEYYKSIVLRTYENLNKKQKRVFTSTRQKEQTIAKLQKLQII